MRRRFPCAIVAAIATFSFFYTVVAGSANAQDGNPEWVAEAESALIGTWTDESDALPNLDIRINRDVLKISAIDPDSDSEDETYEHLYVLAGPDDESSDTARAFASIDTEFGEMHLMLSINGDDLNVEAVQIYKDGSGRTNRMVSSTFVLSDDQEMSGDETATDGKRSASRKKSAVSSRKKSTSTAKKSKAKRSPKVGTIAGQIKTRSTLRGTISISPVEKSMRPADGIVKVSVTNPRFDFSNLPEGEYKVQFEGTINGSSRTVDWKGIKADPADKSPVSLSLRTTESN